MGWPIFRDYVSFRESNPNLSKSLHIWPHRLSSSFRSHGVQGRFTTLVAQVKVRRCGQEHGQRCLKSAGDSSNSQGHGTPLWIFIMTHTIPISLYIFRDSGLGVGLGNSMGKGSHYWGSLKILLIKEQRRRWQAIRSALKNPNPLSE